MQMTPPAKPEPEIGKRYLVECSDSRNIKATWKAKATRIVELDIPKWRLDGYKTKFMDYATAPSDWPWVVVNVIRALD